MDRELVPDSAPLPCQYFPWAWICCECLGQNLVNNLHRRDRPRSWPTREWYWCAYCEGKQDLPAQHTFCSKCSVLDKNFRPMPSLAADPVPYWWRASDGTVLDVHYILVGRGLCPGFPAGYEHVVAIKDAQEAVRGKVVVAWYDQFGRKCEGPGEMIGDAPGELELDDMMQIVDFSWTIQSLDCFESLKDAASEWKSKLDRNAERQANGARLAGRGGLGRKKDSGKPEDSAALEPDAKKVRFAM